MKASLRLAVVMAAALSGGCTDVIWRFGREIPLHHALDPQYARLLKLYQSGQIDAEQLTSRQHALAEREDEIHRRREYDRTHPTPDPFP